MRTLVLLLCSVAILTASGLAAATTPEPVATAAAATAPATASPAAGQAPTPSLVSQDPAAPPAAAPLITPEAGASTLRSLGGTPQHFWALGGNCWGQFSSCRNGCNGNSLCQEGCECTYCVCAGLLCPDYCGLGQN